MNRTNFSTKQNAALNPNTPCLNQGKRTRSVDINDQEGDDLSNLKKAKQFHVPQTPDYSLAADLAFTELDDLFNQLNTPPSINAANAENDLLNLSEAEKQYASSVNLDPELEKLCAEIWDSTSNINPPVKLATKTRVLFNHIFSMLPQSKSEFAQNLYPDASKRDLRNLRIKIHKKFQYFFREDTNFLSPNTINNLTHDEKLEKIAEKIDVDLKILKTWRASLIECLQQLTIDNYQQLEKKQHYKICDQQFEIITHLKNKYKISFESNHIQDNFIRWMQEYIPNQISILNININININNKIKEIKAFMTPSRQMMNSIFLMLTDCSQIELIKKIYASASKQDLNNLQSKICNDFQYFFREDTNFLSSNTINNLTHDEKLKEIAEKIDVDLKILKTWRSSLIKYISAIDLKEITKDEIIKELLRNKYKISFKSNEVLKHFKNWINQIKFK